MKESNVKSFKISINLKHQGINPFMLFAPLLLINKQTKI